MGIVLAVAFFVGICSGGCVPPDPEEAAPEVAEAAPVLVTEEAPTLRLTQEPAPESPVSQPEAAIWEPAPNTPEPAGIRRSPKTVPDLLDDASRRYSLDPYRVRRIAACESTTGTNPRAYSWTAAHRGVMQFDRVTWQERAPLVGISPDWAMAFDDWANIEVAAHTMRAGQWWRWSCK